MRGIIPMPKLDKASVRNNLTTDTEGYVLDARQGKVLKDWQDTEVLSPSAPFAIPSSGNYIAFTLEGITAQHVLVCWNFSSSGDNSPPVDLTWTTFDGHFRITNNGGSTSETICPVFARTRGLTTTRHS